MEGYVYVLTNELMPSVIKIGRTRLSPSARAAELSRSTGVPIPFVVLCHAKFTNHVAAERRLHHNLMRHRVTNRREFFYATGGALEHAEEWLAAHGEPGSVFLADFPGAPA